MTVMEAISNTIVNEFFGSYLLAGITAAFILMMALLLIRCGKIGLEIILLLFTYGLQRGSILPGWIFFIALAVVGIDIAQGLIKAIYG